MTYGPRVLSVKREFASHFGLIPGTPLVLGRSLADAKASLAVNAVQKTSFERWSSQRVEEVLGGLEGVASAQLHQGTFGPQLHVVAEHEDAASALCERIRASLFVHFGQSLDSGQISIGQVVRFRDSDDGGSQEGPPTPDRLVLVEHTVVSDSLGRVSTRVILEWKGKQYHGGAHGSDVAPAQLDNHVLATLRAIESAVGPDGMSEEDLISLHLDGAALVTGLGQPKVLVSINAVRGRDTVTLAGAEGAADNENRAAILATLKATDRWVRGQFRD